MRKHALQLVSLLAIALAIALFVPSRAAADDDDPPTRVARLSHTDGSVSFEPAGTDDWVTAVINRPMTTGDKLWSDNGGRAELHLGAASIRLGSTTGFSFLNLSDSTTQIQMTEGTLRVRVKRLDENETFEIDTPNLAFSVLRPGTYRVDVNEAGDTTIVTVRGGEGEVTGGGQAYSIHAQQTATFSGTDQLNADVQDLSGDDDFDHWCSDRDHREDRSSSSRYVSSDVIGYEDLDDNGGWRPVPEYGNVWFPSGVVVGWAPYHYGHWAYIAPWGYTWVDDAAWGFAPFHYGRWVSVGGLWGWVPGPQPVVGVAYVRPVYAPALVAWVGGPHFGVAVGVGGGFAAGVNVGWFPLGPREVFVPSYPVSRTYVNNVNVTNTTVNTTVVNNYYNTTVVNKNVNVTNVTYVNQSVPGAVTATTPQAFTSAQSVGKNSVQVNQREVASAPVAATTPAVAPNKQAVVGAGAPAAARPPASFATRAVVAKTQPPPPPPTFEKQQAAIKQNGGRPLAMAQVRQIQPAPAARAVTPVKIAPPAKPAVLPVRQNVPANNGAQPPNNTVNKGVQPNVNRPNTPNNTANPPANTKTYSDRPPTSRPATTNGATNANPNGNANAKPVQQGSAPTAPPPPKQVTPPPPPPPKPVTNTPPPKVEQKQVPEHNKPANNDKPAKNDKPPKQEKEKDKPPKR
jgi:hypothetical protein